MLVLIQSGREYAVIKSPTKALAARYDLISEKLKKNLAREDTLDAEAPFCLMNFVELLV